MSFQKYLPSPASSLYDKCKFHVQYFTVRYFEFMGKSTVCKITTGYMSPFMVIFTGAAHSTRMLSP